MQTACMLAAEQPVMHAACNPALSRTTHLRAAVRQLAWLQAVIVTISAKQALICCSTKRRLSAQQLRAAARRQQARQAGAAWSSSNCSSASVGAAVARRGCPQRGTAGARGAGRGGRRAR